MSQQGHPNVARPAGRVLLDVVINTVCPALAAAGCWPCKPAWHAVTLMLLTMIGILPCGVLRVGCTGIMLARILACRAGPDQCASCCCSTGVEHRECHYGSNAGDAPPKPKVLLLAAMRHCHCSGCAPQQVPLLLATRCTLSWRPPALPLCSRTPMLLASPTK